MARELVQTMQAMKEFIDNPNIRRAMEAAHSLLHVCGTSNYRNASCIKCVWYPLCKLYKIDIAKAEAEITDEMLSEMVLDAVKIVAICEAKNA